MYLFTIFSDFYFLFYLYIKYSLRKQNFSFTNFTVFPVQYFINRNNMRRLALHINEFTLQSYKWSATC